MARIRSEGIRSERVAPSDAARPGRNAAPGLRRQTLAALSPEEITGA
jgi:hypothetical protein